MSILILYGLNVLLKVFCVNVVTKKSSLSSWLFSAQPALVTMTLILLFLSTPTLTLADLVSGVPNGIVGTVCCACPLERNIPACVGEPLTETLGGACLPAALVEAEARRKGSVPGWLMTLKQVTSPDSTNSKYLPCQPSA